MNRLGSNLNTFTLMSAGHTVKSQRAAAQMWTVHAIATWKCVNKFVYANTRRFLNKYENDVKNGSESHRRGLEYKPSINLTLFILWESGITIPVLVTDRCVRYSHHRDPTTDRRGRKSSSSARHFRTWFRLTGRIWTIFKKKLIEVNWHNYTKVHFNFK